MKNNKVFKTAASLLAVVILITAVFFFLQKSNTKTEVNNKANIDTKQAEKNAEKVEEKKSEAVTDKSAETKASSDNKEVKGENAKVSAEVEESVKAISKEQGITVFVKSANFGLTAELLVDSSKFNKSYKFYQYSLEGKAISNIESTTKLETTIFPAQEFGSKAKLILFDENKKSAEDFRYNIK